MRKENRLRSGQLSPRLERSVYTFLVHRTLSTNYVRTSDNALKAVPSSKSDWTLSRRRADNATAAKKLGFFCHNF